MHLLVSHITPFLNAVVLERVLTCDPVHIKTEGENSGFAAPAPGQSVPSPATAAAQATDEKDKSASGIGRVRSLLTKKRSVKKGSHPDPTLDDTSAIQKPYIASTTTVKDPAIRATDLLHATVQLGPGLTGRPHNNPSVALHRIDDAGVIS